MSAPYNSTRAVLIARRVRVEWTIGGIPNNRNLQRVYTTLLIPLMNASMEAWVTIWGPRGPRGKPQPPVILARSKWPQALPGLSTLSNFASRGLKAPQQETQGTQRISTFIRGDGVAHGTGSGLRASLAFTS